MIAYRNLNKSLPFCFSMDLEKARKEVWEFVLRESHEIDKLEEELKQLEKLISQGKSDSKNKALQQYYQKKVEHEDHITERIERRLDTWIQRLEAFLGKKEQELQGEDKEHIEEIKRYIDLCRAKLVKVLSYNKGSLHNHIKKEEWDQAEEVIKEAKGNMKNPGMVQLLAVLEKLKEFKPEETSPPKKVIIDFVTSNPELVISHENLTEVSIHDDEQVVEGGRISTTGTESCVGYGLYSPKLKRAYVGHFNNTPQFLRFWKDLDELEDEKNIPFIFGGDGGDISVAILSKILRNFKSLFDESDLPVLCRASPSFWRQNEVNIMPKAKGIYIDTNEGRVRILLDEPISSDKKNELRAMFPDFVEVI